MDYEAKYGLSRLEIRKISKIMRKAFNVHTIFFPVMMVLDMLEVKYPGIVYYKVEEDKEFEEGVMAELVIDEYGLFCIRIRETVYNNAIKGNRGALGIICHEICHFFLIYVLDNGPVMCVSTTGLVFARRINDKEVEAYKSMEWQAKALCGEVMIPYDQCFNMSFEEIVETTKSSDDQTSYFITHIVNCYGGEDE